MAMDEAERVIGLSFDEWLYKADVAKRNVAKPPIKKPQESAVDDYSVISITEINMRSILNVLGKLERDATPPDGYTYIEMTEIDLW